MTETAPRHPTLTEAAWTYARIGLLSFGGPVAQIALMHRVFVEEKRWIGEERFLGALNYCHLLPGPEAQQLATYVGWVLHGTVGGTLAGTLFVLPGYVIIMVLSAVYAAFHQVPAVDALFYGLKAAVLAVVLEAVLRISKKALTSIYAWLLAGAAFIALFLCNVPFPVVVLAAALAGALGRRACDVALGAACPGGLFATAAPAPRSTVKTAGDALLDSGAPHTLPSLDRALRAVAVWGGLWLAPVLLLGLVLGWDNVYSRIAVFFSKMAVVTFGGAYAVLAYVAQQAVEHYGWLSANDMLVGLGLAETTPGPLILVLQYVGFLAAYRTPGMLPPLAAGVLGATLTIWVTFVPCLLWIFLGAPYIEAVRRVVWLKDALAGVTAAVVGVVLNLTVWFGLHVIFGRIAEVRWLGMHVPAPEWATLDPLALLLGVGAALALLRYRVGMLSTLGITALTGLVLRLLLG